VTFTVDTHHHMLPGFFWEATEGDDPVGGIAPRWSRASALSFLDDAGIVPYLAGRFGIIDDMRVIPGTHRRRADGRPRRHGHDADPATGHPASQDPDPGFITRPGHP
jgi:hypothetical protein